MKITNLCIKNKLYMILILSIGVKSVYNCLLFPEVAGSSGKADNQKQSQDISWAQKDCQLPRKNQQRRIRGSCEMEV